MYAHITVGTNTPFTSQSRGTTSGREDRTSVSVMPFFDNDVESSQFQDVNFGEGDSFPTAPDFEYSVQPIHFQDYSFVEGNTAAGPDMSVTPGLADRASVSAMKIFDSDVESNQLQNVNFAEGVSFSTVPGFEYHVQLSHFKDDSLAGGNKAAGPDMSPTPGRADRASVHAMLILDNDVESNQFQDFICGERDSFSMVPDFEYKVQPSHFQADGFAEGSTTTRLHTPAAPLFNASGLPTVRGFRVRWHTQSQVRCDGVANTGGDGSESVPGSQADIFANLETKTHRTDISSAKDTHYQHVFQQEQLQSCARIANFEAFQRVRAHGVKMPGEKRPLPPIFEGPMPHVPPVRSLKHPTVGRVNTLAPAVLTKQKTPVQRGPRSKSAIKHIAPAKYVVPEDGMLDMCLNQIENLFLMDPQGTEVGLMLCNLAGGFDQSADTLQVLKDCFAKKAPATILERTSALWTRAGWMLENEQTTIWDVNERQSYSYMCCLRNNQAAPTKASQLVEAWSPLDSTLGLEKTFCKNVPSPGVQRAAHAMYCLSLLFQQ